MDREMDQEIFKVFGEIRAAHKGRVSHANVEITDGDPMRRAIIASAVSSLLNEQYPESNIEVELVEGRVISVSIKH